MEGRWFYCPVIGGRLNLNDNDDSLRGGGYVFNIWHDTLTWVRLYLIVLVHVVKPETQFSTPVVCFSTWWAFFFLQMEVWNPPKFENRVKRR